MWGGRGVRGRKLVNHHRYFRVSWRHLYSCYSFPPHHTSLGVIFYRLLFFIINHGNPFFPLDFFPSVYFLFFYFFPLWLSRPFPHIRRSFSFDFFLLQTRHYAFAVFSLFFVDTALPSVCFLIGIILKYTCLPSFQISWSSLHDVTTFFYDNIFFFDRLLFWWFAS